MVTSTHVYLSGGQKTHPKPFKSQPQYVRCGFDGEG